jgi:pyridoxamine 5'-phosphate oxidase
MLEGDKMATFNDCLEFVARQPLGFLATVDCDQPRVRPMTVWLADRTGLYFYTSRVKALFTQIQRQPRAEIAFHAGASADKDTILRVAGTVEIVEDMAIRRQLYAKFTWLKNIGTGKPDSPTIVVFRVARGQFNFWTWENNVNPGPWINFP